MNNETKRQLINAAYDVIEDEKLPRPKQIRIVTSLSGMRKTEGTCLRERTIYAHKCIEKSHRIVIYDTIAQYFEDEKGCYIDKKTGRRCRKAILGRERTKSEVKEILGHEISHLKFWKHGAQHTSYTLHIISLLSRKVGDKSL